MPAKWTDADEKEYQALKDEAVSLGIRKPTYGGSGTKEDPEVHDILPMGTMLGLGASPDPRDTEKAFAEAGYPGTGVNKYGQVYAPAPGFPPNTKFVTSRYNAAYQAPKVIPAALSTAASLYPAGWVGRAAMAGMGGISGEMLKQAVAVLSGQGKQTPMRERVGEMGLQGALGAGAELAGTGAAKLTSQPTLVREAAQKLYDAIAGTAKYVTAWPSGAMSGAGYGPTRRLLERPTQVGGAGSPKALAENAARMAEELDAKHTAEAIPSSQNRRDFHDNLGNAWYDTSGIVNGEGGMSQLQKDYVPSEFGHSRYSQAEREALKNINDVMVLPETPASNTVQYELPGGGQVGAPLRQKTFVPIESTQEFPITMSQTQHTLGVKDRALKPVMMESPVSRIESQEAFPFGKQGDTRITGEQLSLPLEAQATGADVAKPMVSDASRVETQYGLPLYDQFTTPIESGVPATIPQTQMSFDLPQVSRYRSKGSDLLKLADNIDAQLEASVHNPGVTPTSKAHQENLYRIRGKIKEALHNDPLYASDFEKEAAAQYAAGDKKFSEFAADEKLLRGVHKEATAESFLKALANPEKKFRMKEAAKRITPEAYQNILDMEAAQAFAPAGSLHGLISPNRAIQFLSGTAGAAAGAMAPAHNRELSLALGGTAAMLTSPAAHRFVLMNAAKALEQNAIRRGLFQGGTRYVPWRLMKELEQEKK